MLCLHTNTHKHTQRWRKAAQAQHSPWEPYRKLYKPRCWYSGCCLCWWDSLPESKTFVSFHTDAPLSVSATSEICHLSGFTCGLWQMSLAYSKPEPGMVSNSFHFPAAKGIRVDTGKVLGFYRLLSWGLRPHTKHFLCFKTVMIFIADCTVTLCAVQGLLAHISPGCPITCCS